MSIAPIDPHPTASRGALIEPLVAGGDGHPGVRLTPAFVVEAVEAGSRDARLAMLAAYERARGDDWCLHVVLAMPGQDGVDPALLTRGLLELEDAIIRVVRSLPDAARRTAAIEIRPAPSETR